MADLQYRNQICPLKNCYPLWYKSEPVKQIFRDINPSIQETQLIPISPALVQTKVTKGEWRGKSKTTPQKGMVMPWTIALSLSFLTDSSC